jgi:cholinesterase
VHTDVNLY